jgi:membrane protease YdiL (CAAX protease family)
LGACAAALAIALAAAGGARLAVTPPGAEASVGPIAVGLLLAALSEELVFRGYPLRRLAEAIGPRLAILLLAGGFAAAHLGNPDVTPLAVLNIALAGLWLSLAFFSPGGMASAWGLHFGWNATLGALFGAPVSGYTLAARALHYTPGGPLWLGGGRFGPEGGVVGTIALVAGTVAVLGTRATAPERWVTP